MGGRRGGPERNMNINMCPRDDEGKCSLPFALSKTCHPMSSHDAPRRDNQEYVPQTQPGSCAC